MEVMSLFVPLGSLVVSFLFTFNVYSELVKVYALVIRTGLGVVVLFRDFLLVLEELRIVGRDVSWENGFLIVVDFVNFAVDGVFELF